MKNILLLSLLSVFLVGCKSLYNPNLTNKTKIEIPEEIRHGECEKDRALLAGNTSRDLVNYAASLIDHIEQCKIEKASLINQIDKINGELK